MKRRPLLGTIGASMVLTAASGCLGGSTADNTDNSRNGIIALRNEMDNTVTAKVTVSPKKEAEEPVLEDEYELGPNSTKEETIDIETSKYEVSASMPNGPVESIFTHKWNIESESSLTITFTNNGVNFS